MGKPLKGKDFTGKGRQKGDFFTHAILEIGDKQPQRLQGLAK